MEIIKIQEAPSSNTVALEMLGKQNLSEGTVIWVENQTKGRGQNNNIWQSEPGKNLTFSIIFKPAFLKPENQFYLSKVISLGIADYVGLFCSNVAIKWFNDIFIEDKKVAGILIESLWLGQKINASVAGIGLNINQDKFPDNLSNAVSLKMKTAVPFVLEKSLRLLYELIITRYEQLKLNKFITIDKDYHSILYCLGQKCAFLKDNEMFKSVILGVEPNGYIKLKHDNDKIMCYGMHEIKML